MLVARRQGGTVGREAGKVETMRRNERGEAGAGLLIRLAVVLVVVLVAAFMFIGPQYRVWQQGMEGEAKLMRAKQERQILVTQAQAEKDAAQLRADAIGIMGKAAQSFPEYRQQEFMAAFGEALREGNISQIVYVPTEANIPIMEAGGQRAIK